VDDGVACGQRFAAPLGSAYDWVMPANKALLRQLATLRVLLVGPQWTECAVLLGVGV